MNASNDTQQDHGSHEQRPAQGRDPAHRGHSGHGAASALERLRDQASEWPQAGTADEAAGDARP